jgi:hypothetical protein
MAVIMRSTAKKVEMSLAKSWLSNSYRSRPVVTRNDTKK